MLSDSQMLIFSAPYLVFIPGVAIMTTVLDFNLLPDDPLERGEGDAMF